MMGFLKLADSDSPSWWNEDKFRFKPRVMRGDPAGVGGKEFRELGIDEAGVPWAGAVVDEAGDGRDAEFAEFV